MAEKEHLAILMEGAHRWDLWRAEQPKVKPDLRGADLSHADLVGVNLDNANLRGANFTEAILFRAGLRHSNLFGATLDGADLSWASLYKADLRGASLRSATLFWANLVKAKLQGAHLERSNLRSANFYLANLKDGALEKSDLTGAALVGTNLEGANLTGCCVYGISAWDLILKKTQQTDLIITRPDEPEITVDNLEVAQFIYLLLNNKKIRNVIEAVGRKGVLILGRFTPERKSVLDAIRQELRRLGYVPIMFDFDRPSGKDFTETIMTLASMSRFVIADITNPKSSPLELQATIPNYMVPFVPIIQEGEEPFAMFADLHGKYDWVLEPLEYDTEDNLIANLQEEVIDPAEDIAEEIMRRKAAKPTTRKLRKRR
jgi:hypothetical protein